MQLEAFFSPLTGLAQHRCQCHRPLPRFGFSSAASNIRELYLPRGRVPKRRNRDVGQAPPPSPFVCEVRGLLGFAVEVASQSSFRTRLPACLILHWSWRTTTLGKSWMKRHERLRCKGKSLRRKLPLRMQRCVQWRCGQRSALAVQARLADAQKKVAEELRRSRVNKSKVNGSWRKIQRLAKVRPSAPPFFASA